jgi:hypothetical protein
VIDSDAAPCPAENGPEDSELAVALGLVRAAELNLLAAKHAHDWGQALARAEEELMDAERRVADVRRRRMLKQAREEVPMRPTRPMTRR